MWPYLVIFFAASGILQENLA